MRIPSLVVSLLLAGSCLSVFAVTEAAADGAALISTTRTWIVHLPDQATANGGMGPIAQSSPIIANLDRQGGAIIVGDRKGYLYAVHRSDGSPVSGWPVRTGSARNGPIDAPASVARLPGHHFDTVFIGVGTDEQPVASYAYQSFSASGVRRWAAQATDVEPEPFHVHGVTAGLALGPIDHGQLGVFAGTTAQSSQAFNARSGALMWNFYTADSTHSTASLSPLKSGGPLRIIVGGDSTAGNGFGTWYENGGHVRIMSTDGQLRCELKPVPNETVDSSTAVGRFLPGRRLGIVVGTGTYWHGSDQNSMIAMNPHCGLVWKRSVRGSTLASPALADTNGDGKANIVEITSGGANKPGWLYVLDGRGRNLPGFPLRTQGPIWGTASPVTADLTGQGYQDILVPTLQGLEIYDGRSGALVGSLPGTEAIGMQNAPLVSQRDDGTVEITIAGYQGTSDHCAPGLSGCLQGVIAEYVVNNLGATIGNPKLSWPMFHHDPQLSGALGDSS